MITNSKKYLKPFLMKKKVSAISMSNKRGLQTDKEVIPKQDGLLSAERLREVEKNERLYPSKGDTTKILELDKSNASVSIDTAEIEKAYQRMEETLEPQGMGTL